MIELIPTVLTELATFFRDYKEYAFLAVFVVAWAWERRENQRKEGKILELAIVAQRSRIKHSTALHAVYNVLEALDRKLGAEGRKE